jgi:hypothetical protein
MLIDSSHSEGSLEKTKNCTLAFICNNTPYDAQPSTILHVKMTVKGTGRLRRIVLPVSADSQLDHRRYL